MALVVVVHPADEFESWLDGVRRDATAPTTTLARDGARVFLGRGCASCHTIRGTEARGTAGPDLTHFGARRTIAAGELPNTSGHLSGWLTNPHAVKPGTHMPRVALRPDELQALVAYLGGLR